MSVDKARQIGEQAGRSLISRSEWLRQAVESRLLGAGDQNARASPAIGAGGNP